MKLICATSNKGKQREIKQALQGRDIEWVGLDQIPEYPPTEEDQGTFWGNALKKAFEASQAGELPALADDSGLVIPALGGRPGVYSARFAGEDVSYDDNIDKVLKLMEGKKDRRAYFISVCVIVLGSEMVFGEESRCWGEILEERSQGKEGFGYDPIFREVSMEKSFSQISLEQKNRISHRGKSLKKLQERIDQVIQRVEDTNHQ